ncbi:Protein CADMIUM RESISTANCE 2 [Sarracenia purpurea var. burkii]
MYSSTPIDYQKHSAASPPPPPPYGQPADGIPVSSGDHFYGKDSPQPPVQLQARRPAPLSPWSTDLCDCIDDIPNCCITLWCPCITFGQIAEIVDKGSTSCATGGALYTLISLVTGCPCLYSCFYRSKLRRQFYLNENPCADCLVHCCCELCALCQEYRELKNRGFDLKLGWQGNVEQHHRELGMTPVVQEGMSR